MATIVDVARLANVSRVTVTRVLNEPEKVKPTTRARVQKAIKELSYTPNFSARSLVSKRSGIVGMLIPDNESGFFGSVMSVVHKAVNESGRMLVVLEAQGIEEERKALNKLLDLNCDGLLLYSRYLSGVEIADKAQQRPFVLIDRHEENCCCVYFDHFISSYVLAKSVLDAGHRHIGIIAGPNDRRNAIVRLEGALQAVEDAALPDTQVVSRQGNYGQKFGETATEEILSQHPHLTALVYLGERMCAGGLKAIRANNISVPNDLSVVSFDSFNLTEYLVPHINNVVFPIAQMAELAAEKILIALKNKTPDLHSVEVKHQVIGGNSLLNR
ncbi:LacI family DNA-binding transcriptional regulator [Vibrio mangrovi]|uniref:HTH-type transcriptional regulator AscG n=1 Tax=Vibrio mangrovi TaxID=474394 RepID=A0A1Y6IT21_9VIBR|nr:LacI family DNA-binding transcriptional regulator [Vibrio mangrovi]MDW6004488.1 LacI family DNA-binding transcriptional regulator [Vibrio mangrovi]SMS00776.1 HTH-type transcriptional regulator AscG [Vibrio mangrovi]